MSRNKFSHSTQDEYYTPYYAVDIIIPYISKDSTIWCPFDTEDSKYVKRFREMGHNVFATHIDHDQDFLTYTPDFEFDVIVSNPPFSIKSEILEKCIDYDKPFALLLPFTMFNSIKTVRQMSRTSIEFIVMDRRISFDGNRPNFTCWYVTHGLLDANKTYLFDTDPRKLYEREISKQTSVKGEERE